jgi:hypothetical protein
MVGNVQESERTWGGLEGSGEDREEARVQGGLR